MQNNPLGQRPKYAVSSVDSALQLLQILRDEGEVRVHETAAALGLAPSTVHRLLGMLVYRGFAVQDENRSYRPGPGVDVPSLQPRLARHYRQRSRGILQRLAAETGETVNLVLRFGPTVRFLETIVGSEDSVVSSRKGQVLSARRASGGKAMLAFLPPASLVRLFRSEQAKLSGEYLAESEFASFSAQLVRTRDLGYAVNREETESGVCAVGMSIRTPEGRSRLAFSLSVPTMRLKRVLRPEFLEMLNRCRLDLNLQFGDVAPDAPMAGGRA